MINKKQKQKKNEIDTFRNKRGRRMIEANDLLVLIKKKIDHFYAERETIDLVDEQDLIAEISLLLDENIAKSRLIAEDL